MNLLLVKGAGLFLGTCSICLPSVISGMCLIHELTKVVKTIHYFFICFVLLGYFSASLVS